jgi:hypothetical protein
MSRSPLRFANSLFKVLTHVLKGIFILEKLAHAHFFSRLIAAVHFENRKWLFAKNNQMYQASIEPDMKKVKHRIETPSNSDSSAQATWEHDRDQELPDRFK